MWWLHCTESLSSWHHRCLVQPWSLSSPKYQTQATNCWAFCCTAWSLLGLACQNFAKSMFLTVSFLSSRMSLPAWRDSRLQDQKPYTSGPSSHDQQITYWYILMTWMIHQPLLWRVLHSTSVMLPIQHFYSLTIIIAKRSVKSKALWLHRRYSYCCSQAILKLW